MRRLVHAGVSFCLITLVGCGESSEDSGTPAPEPSFAEHSCSFELPEGLTFDDFRCGTLTTALVHDNFDGRTVDVEAAVLRARSEEAEEDPLLFFGGGPGVYNLDSYLQTQAAGVLAPINEVRDVVFLDPRGLGRSRPSLACPEMADTLLNAYTQDQSGAQDAENGWLAGYRACYDRLIEEGIEPSHHHSASIAQDASELMEALGYESYHIYGISYGARFVQAMLRDQPEDVLSAILDSPILIEESFGTQWAPNLQRSLDVLFAECEASPSCRQGSPNLEETFYQVIADLNASPRSLEVETPSGPRTLLITGDRLAVGVANALYLAELIPLMPTAISVTATGSDLSIQQFGASLLPSVSTFDYGYYASILCAEEIAFDSPESLAKAEEGVSEEVVNSWGAVNGPLFLELCEFWEVETRPSIEREPVESNIPTLVLSGQYDPATPPSYGQQAASNLANSQFFLFNGVGHGVLRSQTAESERPRCAQRIVVAFLDDPASPVDGSCAQELPSPI